jgi:hypothetical protein
LEYKEFMEEMVRSGLAIEKRLSNSLLPLALMNSQFLWLAQEEGFEEGGDLIRAG